MCGIAGFVDFSGHSGQAILAEMTRLLAHRGPDGEGLYHCLLGQSEVGLGHRRLSVIDLSVDAGQPMHFGQYSLVYNGEVYNYLEIKAELESLGHRFKSTSDTEVILQAFDRWGIDCVQRFIGMFAFVIFDKQAQKVYAFRDRTGVKPLYYYWFGGLFLFASELKSFHAHPHFKKEVDASSLVNYFDLGYIPGPWCIFKHTAKLQAGHYLVLDITNCSLEACRYWNPVSFYQLPKLNITMGEAKAQLSELLQSAFQYRMLADVPVGVFLSGGYDSTAVAAILQKEQTKAIKTFTIGFEAGNNEAPYAKQIARYLGTDHHELICTAQQAQAIIPDLASYYDEPFADSSAIPTILLSREARKSVTVALSADGGDELFAGYRVYGRWLHRRQQLAKIPSFSRPLIAQAARTLAAALPAKATFLQHKLQTVDQLLQLEKGEAALYRQMAFLPDRYKRQLLATAALAHPTPFDDSYPLSDQREHPLLVDYCSYLPGDILTKVDRATMSASLEGREPLLDHRLLEWAAQLPFSYKYAAGMSKKILKEVVHQYVPHNLMDRPKAGFSIPFDQWFMGALKPLLFDTLSPARLANNPMINAPFVQDRLQEFERGQLHYRPLLWKLFMYQQWWERWML